MKKTTDFRALTKYTQLKGRVIKEIVMNYGTYNHNMLLIFDDDTFVRFKIRYNIDNSESIDLIDYTKEIAKNLDELYDLSYGSCLFPHKPFISKEKFDIQAKKEEKAKKEERYKEYLKLKQEFENETK